MVEYLKTLSVYLLGMSLGLFVGEMIVDKFILTEIGLCALVPGIVLQVPYFHYRKTITQERSS